MKEIRKFKRLLQAELKEMEKLNSFVKRSLKKAPEGKLVLSTSNGVTQYYWKKEDSQIKGEYLDKKELN